MIGTWTNASSKGVAWFKIDDSVSFIWITNSEEQFNIPANTLLLNLRFSLARLSLHSTLVPKNAQFLVLHSTLLGHLSAVSSYKWTFLTCRRELWWFQLFYICVVFTLMCLIEYISSIRIYVCIKWGFSNAWMPIGIQLSKFKSMNLCL